MMDKSMYWDTIEELKKVQPTNRDWEGISDPQPVIEYVRPFVELYKLNEFQADVLLHIVYEYYDQGEESFPTEYETMSFCSVIEVLTTVQRWEKRQG